MLLANGHLIAIAQWVFAEQQVEIYLKLFAEGLILKLLILSHVAHVDAHSRSLDSLHNGGTLLLRKVIGNLHRHHDASLQVTGSGEGRKGDIANNAEHE